MAKQGTYRKCGRNGIIHSHHIYPKNIFGDQPPVIELCPNCHEDFHELLGKEHLKNPSRAFHASFFYSWLFGIIGCLALLFWYFI